MRLGRGLAGLLMVSALSSVACTEILLGDKRFVHDDESAQGGGGGGESTSTVLVCDEGTTACSGACVDLDSDSRHCGACDHDCLGSSCDAGLCAPQDIATNVNDPRGLAVDDAFVYWTAVDGTVNRAPKSGGAVEVLATGQGSPGSIAVDSDNAYWIDDESGRVLRLPKNSQSNNPKQIAITTDLVSLALGADSVYVSKKNQQGEIRRIGKSDGGGDKTIVSGQPHAAHIVVLGDRVIWSGTIEPDDGMAPIGGYVRHATFDGDGLIELAAGEGAVSALTVAGDNPVWADSRAHEIRMSRGTPDQPFTLIDEQDVRGLAGDATSVYWTTAGGTVRRLSVAGGEDQVLAFDIAGAGAAVVDATHVYFLRTGAVSRVAK